MASLLFTCGISALFFAAVQCTAPNRQPLHYCMAIACVAGGCALLSLSAVASGLARLHPALANADIAALFLLSPAFYLASLTILHEGRRPVRRYRDYFVVPAGLAAGSGLYAALSAAPLRNRLGAAPGHFSNPALTALTLAADLSFTAAVVLALLAAGRLRRAGRVHDRASFAHQVVFLFGYLATCPVVLAGWVLRDERLYLAGCLATGVVIVFYVLSRTAVTYFAAERSSRRPARERPEWESSAPELTARLAHLMEQTALYRNERLTLRRLAGMLGEEPKRLSYHLNVSLSRSFRTYLNEWRLAAVARDLLAQPCRPILDIALANGFNSKSSFNTLFHGKYGLTPKQFRQFRRKHLAEEGDGKALT